MKTRFDANGEEKQPTLDFLERFDQSMEKLFNQGHQPYRIEYWDVFRDGRLRVDVFERCWQQIDKQSTPGYPFLGYSKNADLNPLDVYNLMDSTLRLWILDPIDCDLSEVLDPELRIHYYSTGHLFPAKIFIKGEATDISKIARPIHGLSVIINGIARILYGDYLNKCKDTWFVEAHKVGMDFNTHEGLTKLTYFYDNLLSMKRELEAITGRKLKIECDDVQSWEFQVRAFMVLTWHKHYKKRANASPFQQFLISCYVYHELLQLAIDSDGYVHSYPFFVRMSGVVLTHKENSDERSALFKADQHLHWADYPTDMDNGDDCDGIKFHEGIEESTTFGFVHTDRKECDEFTFYFSSQEFYRETTQVDGVSTVFKRRPDGVHKLLYNLLAADGLTAALDIMQNVSNHSMREVFDQILRIKLEQRQLKY